jgi:hypothetical protein
VTLLLLPLSLATLAGILALASHLEGRRVQATVRLSIRSRRASPEHVESVIAAELAPVLAAHGVVSR